MPASYPKPDGEKRTRVKSDFTWTVLPREGRPGPAPKLPGKTPDGRAWSKATRDWWSWLWSTPQATQWAEQDAELLARVIVYERMLRGEATASELAEARQIDDRHGLNPKAMLQLRWRVGSSDEEGGDGAPSSRPGARRKSNARRRAAMTVIDGGG